MARYRRLSLMEREELSRMLAAGHSLRATAQALSELRVPCRVNYASPDLARTYRAVPAHQRAQRGAPPAQAPDTRRPSALAHRGLQPARAALVPRTDCSRLAAAVS